MEFRGLGETLARVALVGLLFGGAWLTLQFYTEDEIAQGARDFWTWWSTLLGGELGTYWNPIGAGVALTVIVLFVTAPITRLFRSRHGHDSHDGYYGDGDGDGDSD